ncbi:hypothetical protein PUN28_006385 [Cardiocondyla obscurior]|uniref:Uncharacterized protein n=1 Tax=Cardiocondyla obscurior TaxID=286306 RepID=A0AAW2G8Z9_9HYME
MSYFYELRERETERERERERTVGEKYLRPRIPRSERKATDSIYCLENSPNEEKA